MGLGRNENYPIKGIATINSICFLLNLNVVEMRIARLRKLPLEQ